MPPATAYSGACKRLEDKEWRAPMLNFLRSIRFAAVIAAAAAMLVTATLPSNAETGSVRLRITKAGFIVGVGGGSGTLVFRGRSYPLRVGGISVGTIGVASADLVGFA